MEKLYSRRSFAKIGGTAALSLALFGLAGCGPARSENKSEEVKGEAADAGAEATSDALVVYFSRADENYRVGFIEEGNTAVLAKMIAEKKEADIFEIKPVNEYPEGYDECCDVALEEQEQGARPEIAEDIDVSAYSTIYLGYPIWWGDLPMCVYTFLEAHDWSGKEIHPFCTHEGSGLSGTVSTIESVCAGSTVGEGLSLNGEVAQNSRDEAEAAVEEWLG